jgi:hypothetical protein
MAFSETACRLAGHLNVERDLFRALRAQGACALSLEINNIALERLNNAISRARGVRFVEEGLAALTALAELHRVVTRRNRRIARKHLPRTTYRVLSLLRRQHSVQPGA